MHILIGLCLALALLYFWLIGHWFARRRGHRAEIPRRARIECVTDQRIAEAA
jgi:hypothetical protein